MKLWSTKKEISLVPEHPVLDWVCVCTLLDTRRFFSFVQESAAVVRSLFLSMFTKQGASSSFSLAPTKTLNVAGDIRADHPDVPVSEMAKG